MNTPADQPDDESQLTGQMIKSTIGILLFMAVMGVILFVAAGTLNWAMGWAYLAVLLGIFIAGLLVVPIDQEIVEERTTLKDDVKTWDKALAGVMSIFYPVALLIVAGLDKRFGWTGRQSLAIQIAALVAGVGGYSLSVWAMVVNKFFARFVRIQTERGHVPITGGPYRLVRHPGYLGTIIFLLASALALGSLWTFVPAGVMSALLVVRTALEDKTLRAELDGYEEYTRQTRYRLFPGIW